MINKPIQIRKAVYSDVNDIFLLANDEVVRRNSFSSEEIKFENHEKWFASKLESKNCIFYVLKFEGRFAGHAHIDLDEETDNWEISIYITRENRGKKLGEKLLKDIISQNRDKNLVAFVKDDNTSSNKLFRSCNFLQIRNEIKNNCEVNVYSLEKRKVLNVIAISNELYDDVFDLNDERYIFIKNKEDFTFERLKKINPEYVFLPHWSFIIKKDIHETFNCVIFHMTDLPFGRGGSPLQNLISRGIYKTKISAIKCTSVLDGGDIFLKKDFSLEEKSAQELYRDAGFIIKEMIDEITMDRKKPTPQIGDIVSFPRRTSDMSDISNLGSIIQIFDYIRMLDAPGYPNAFLKMGNFKLSFTNAKKENGKIYANVEIEENPSE